MEYRFEIVGTNASANEWKTSGAVFAESLDEAFRLSMKSSFDQLTHGKAVFGQPGKGCSGPYQIHHVAIDRAGAKLALVKSNHFDPEFDLGAQGGPGYRCKNCGQRKEAHKCPR